MDETLRQEQHIAEKGIYCPNCGHKDSIIYWKEEGSNINLLGKKINNMIRIKPTCSQCGKVFSKGTMFPRHR
jgi:DNA-directed RNA polymerase subunit RPC12/RpoP